MDADDSVTRTVTPPQRRSGASTSELQAEFFRMHYRDLIAITMYVGANLEEAKEAVARTLLEVVQKWDVIKDPRKWSSQAAIHHFLKEKSRGPDRLRKRLMEKGAAATHPEDDAQLTLWEDEQWVTQTLAQLPPKQAEAMALIIDGFTPTEIAEMLGRTPAAVRQNLLEARRRLKLAIEKERPGEQAARQH